MKRSLLVVAFLFFFFTAAPLRAQVAIPPPPPLPPELQPVVDALAPTVCTLPFGSVPADLSPLVSAFCAAPAPAPEPAPSTEPPPDEAAVEPEAVEEPTFSDMLLPELANDTSLPIEAGSAELPVGSGLPADSAASVQPALEAGGPGYAYPVVFALPLILLAIGGYLGRTLTRPVPAPQR